MVAPLQPLQIPQEANFQIRDLTFSYAGDLPPALDHFSLDLSPGRRIALIGPSGAGKTTLTYLIPRLYDPSSGRILIDDGNLELVVLEKQPEGWKVFDVVVAGVSLVTNYRESFAQEIRASGIDGLTGSRSA